MADALCRVLTGGGFMTRKLYSDTEQILIEATRPILSNGITDITDRPDLIDRSILMSLPPIDKRNRETEAQIKKEEAEAMPRFLGCIYDCIACALRKARSRRRKNSVWRTRCTGRWRQNRPRAFQTAPSSRP